MFRNRRAGISCLPQSGCGLFGPEQARFAAEYWVNELEFMDALPGLTRRDGGQSQSLPPPDWQGG